MRKNVLFIAKFDNILKSMNTILAKDFNMQMCPPETVMLEKTLDVMEIDIILLYISGLPYRILSALCSTLADKCTATPIVVVGTNGECMEFDSYCAIVITKYMYRPLAAQNIAKAIRELLKETPKPKVTQNPEINNNMSLAELADSLDSDDRRCILLVDDDGRILRAMKMLLERTYKINIANSGVSALESIERERPDVVLLDYEMPILDGKKTLELIRENKTMQDLPVFFLTGVADKEKIRDVIHLKPQGYLLKSSEQSVILDTLEKFFASS